MFDKFSATSSNWDLNSDSLSLSIVVPVFNTRAYLRQALDSLVSAPLSQVEVIIVHDGGADGSLALAVDWVRHTPMRACVIDQANAGLSAARMAGLARARGRFVGFLDSDDLADVAVLAAMAEAGEGMACDVVLCRSVVLESNTFAVSRFYDAHIWDLIMGGRRFRRVTLDQEPRLLRLEPNANPRVIRRSFLHQVGLAFPEGLLFEDMAPHVHGLARAGHVGLLNETGYWYRVGRPGKITDERSARRFDAIHSVGLAIDAAAGLSREACANLALQAVRLLYWCAQNVTNADRARFLREAIGVVRRLEPETLRLARVAYSTDERERLLLGAFATGAHRVLYDMAGRRRPAPWPWLRLAMHPEGRTVVKLGLRALARPALGAARRIGGKLRGAAHA